MQWLIGSNLMTPINANAGFDLSSGLKVGAVGSIARTEHS